MARGPRHALIAAAITVALLAAGILPGSAAPGATGQRGMMAVVDGQSSTGGYGAPLVQGCQWATWVARCSNLTAFGNGSSFSDSGCGPPNGCTFGPEFQCTELAQRYAYYAWGEPAIWSGYGGGDGSAAQMWIAGPALPIPLQQFAQGGGVAPQVGDLLVFAPGWLGSYWDGNGHVAVVSAVGTNYVDIVQENGTATGTDRLGLSGSAVIANGYTPIIGWLHNPLMSVTGVDKLTAASSGNQQIVFWQGGDNHLHEAWASAGVWNGPLDLTLLWGGAAPLTAAPAAVFSSTGGQSVYWRGAGGHLWQSTFAGDWTTPVDLSTNWTTDQMLLSAPAAAVTSNGQQMVFWQGATGALWEAWSAGGAWYGPVNQSAAWRGFLPLTSAPTVAVGPDGVQYVYWQAVNGDLLEAWYAGSWNGPVDLTRGWNGQGKVGSSPTVAFAADGSQGVFWKGTDNNLWEAWFNGAWNGPVDWDSLGPIRSAPAVTSVPGGRQSAFWQNAAGDLSVTTWTGGWNGPVDQSATWKTGLLASAPSVAVAAKGAAQVSFWRGTDGHLWEAWYTDHWNGPVDWTSQWGSHALLASAPSVTIAPDGQTQVIFWQGTNGHLWEAWFSGSWNGPVDWTATWRNAPALGSAPSVLIKPDGTQGVFWRGLEGHLWEAWFTGSWNGPADWSANWVGTPVLASAPGVGVTADGASQVVFWQDRLGHLEEAWYTTSWNGPVDRSTAWNAGALLGSSPSLVMAPGGEQLIYWQGADGHLWEAWWGGSWSAPIDWASAGYVPGQLASAPSAAVVNGQQAVFWRGSSGHLIEAWWGGAWTTPTAVTAAGSLS